MDVSARILQVESDLRQLIKRWDRFFVGDLRVPPVQERDLLGRRLRLLSEQYTRRSVDAFRLKQLQHRYMAYASNWERMLREREEGIRRYVPGQPLRSESPLDPAPEQRVDPAATNGMASASVDDDGTLGLFDLWMRAKEGLGQGVKINRVVFDRQIEAQRLQLEKKMGHPVEFEVSIGDGRVKLTVRRAEGRESEE